MSVLEDLRGLEGRVASRMQELRPLVDEYRELEAVAERLGLRLDEPTNKRGQRAAPRRRAGASARTASVSRAQTGSRRSTPGQRRRRRKVAPRGQRQQQMLELVNARPGITVREIGKQLGVDPTSLYRIVRVLEQEGRIKKDGSGLQPA
jgi:Winged helix-turn-helix DNA-binding